MVVCEGCIDSCTVQFWAQMLLILRSSMMLRRVSDCTLLQRRRDVDAAARRASELPALAQSCAYRDDLLQVLLLDRVFVLCCKQAFLLQVCNLLLQLLGVDTQNGRACSALASCVKQQAQHKVVNKLSFITFKNAMQIMITAALCWPVTTCWTSTGLIGCQQVARDVLARRAQHGTTERGIAKRQMVPAAHCMPYITVKPT